MREVKCDICGKSEEDLRNGVLSGEDCIEDVDLNLPDFSIETIELNRYASDMCEECAIKEFKKQMLECLKNEV